MKNIFPVTVEELSTGDTYTFKDLPDLKIFVEEFKDILVEFKAMTAGGQVVILKKDILFADTLMRFIENIEYK